MWRCVRDVRVRYERSSVGSSSGMLWSGVVLGGAVFESRVGPMSLLLLLVWVLAYTYET